MAPEVLGNRYEVGRPIGCGAMTRVLEACDRHEHRHVTLKVLTERLAGDEAFLGPLEREAEAAASLAHPNIAAVHAVRWDSRIRFVVTELVDGPSLRDMLAGRGPLPPVGAGRFAANVCAALAAAHRRGVTHGHLTSANVLLAIDGQVKVTDFRLAQAATPAAANDPAADLRGVGRCMAAMLTGRELAATTRQTTTTGQVVGPGPTHRPQRGGPAPAAGGRHACPSTARYPDGPDAGQRVRAGPAGGRSAAIGRPGLASRVRGDRAGRHTQANRLRPGPQPPEAVHSGFTLVGTAVDEEP